jgi:hypothetical protein
LLIDSVYIDKVKECIIETVDDNKELENKCLLWDLIKCNIRGMTVNYSSFKAKCQRKLECELKHRLEELEKLLPENDDAYSDYETTKREYEDIQKHKMQGIMIRSRAKFVEQGERNSKYFLNLEKHNQSIKNIKCLLGDDGAVITGPVEILNEQIRFYTTLYTETDTERHLRPEIGDFLDTGNLPRINEASQRLCDEQITLAECGQSLKLLSNSKAPGTDGLTSEFYKFFWPDIKELLLDSYRHSYETGKLSVEQRRGILSIIPKKDKDLRLLKNWRPLSLLNTDYKILTKVFATRLQNVLNEVVSPDQNGYIKGRFIGENVRLITDIIEYKNRTNGTGMIALLDFENGV